MIDVFLLTSELEPCPGAAVARVLALELPRERFSVAVGVLGPTDGPIADELRAAGVPVHSLPIRHQFDLNGVRRLRRTIREAAPAVLHVFGPEAARTARLIVASRGEAGNMPRLVVSAGATPGSGFGAWFAARQVRRADRIVATTWAEGERYRRLRVNAERLCRISPAAPELPLEPDRSAILRGLGIHPTSRLIVADGRIASASGPKDAIVAFDMLRYEARDLYLVVFGAGERAPMLERFGRSLAFDDFRVRFPNNNLDRATAVRLAMAVWVTAPRGGAEETLEAMVAGKPVVAWGTADLTEIMDDGVTGFLVPVGDRAALAAKARLLLEDPTTAARMGAAGRARADERFPVTRMVEQFGRVYAELAIV